MKKVLFALCAVLTLGLASCVKPGETTTDVVITIEPASVTLSPGDEQRLKTVIEPAGTQVTLTWTSSDPSVATVSKAGLVTAVADGECTITASAEGAKQNGTCKVTVSAGNIYDAFEIVGYGLFGDFTPIPGTDTVITLSDGGEYNVQLNTISYILTWDGNVTYNKGWAGAGLSAIIPDVAFWVIKGGEFDGYYVGAGGFGVADLKGKVARAYGQAGAFVTNQVGQFLETMLVAKTSEDVDWDAMEAGFPGAQIQYIDADNDDWSMNWGGYYAHIKNLELEEDENDEIYYAGDIEWHEFVEDGYYFGLKVNLNAEGKIESVAKPYEYKGVPKHIANFDESASAPRELKLYAPSTIHSEIPAWVKRLPTTNFYKK